MTAGPGCKFACRPCWLLVAAALLTVLCYLPSIRGPFLFDDLSEISSNPAIRTLWPPWRPMFEGGELPHRPVPYYTFAANYAAGRLLAGWLGISPLDPLPFHLVNLAIHLLNGWLACWLVYQLLLPDHRHEQLAAATPVPLPLVAGVVAGLWLVHPIQTEAVSYVYQRIELLATTAALATAGLFLRGVRAPRPGGWLIASVFTCGIGMACKEWFVVVPLIMLLADRAFVAASWRQVFSERWPYHAGLLATLTMLAGILAVEQAKYPEQGFTLQKSLFYLLNQPAIILWYLSLLVVPVGQALDHGTPLRTDLLGADWWLLVPVAAASLVFGWAIVVFPKRPRLAFPVLAFFLLLAPTSSLLPVHDLCVEHRMYLPSLIPLALVVIGVTAAARRVAVPGVAVPPTAVLLGFAGLTGLVFAGTAAARNMVYRSPLAAWGDAVQKSGSARAYSRYGTELSKLDRHSEAIAACGEAVRLNPASPVPFTGLAAALINAGQLNESVAVCQRGLTAGRPAAADRRGDRLPTDPVRQRLQMYLGLALDRLGDRRGRSLLVEAVRLAPDSLPAKEHLARSLLADDPAASAQLWRQLVAADPRDGYYRFNLGSALARFDPRAAVPELKQAIGLDPANADACNNLGNALLAIGDATAAAAAYRQCLAIAPDHPQAKQNLAILAGKKSAQ